MSIKGLLQSIEAYIPRLSPTETKKREKRNNVFRPLTCGIGTAHRGRIPARMVRYAIPEIIGNRPGREEAPVGHRAPIPRSGEEVVLLGVIETTAGVLVGPGDNREELSFGEGSGGLGRQGPAFGDDATVP